MTFCMISEIPSMVSSIELDRMPNQEMDPFILAEPLLFFSFTTALFVFAMKTPPSSVKRQILAGFHVLLVAMSLQASPLVLSFYPGITIPFVIGVTFHTTALIIFDQHVMDLRSLSFSQQAWALMRTWMNIRRLARAGYPDYHEKITGSSERLSFLICQSYQIIILWAVGRVIGVLYPFVLLELGVQPRDFAPERQGILPILTPRDFFSEGNCVGTLDLGHLSHIELVALRSRYTVRRRTPLGQSF
ncbi:hypothetical protein F4808DRAFT_446800 [Astrocystis sublimbata]|nr:hypothetical protein F4808DRAFT_446800 [Astrocystis sublimbata]